MSLARLRRNKGYSQRTLAKAAGISPSTIYEVEAGRHSPNPSTLRKLAEALDLEPEEIMEAIEAPKEIASLSRNDDTAEERRLRDLRNLRDVYQLLAQAWEKHPPETSVETTQLTEAIAALVEQGIFKMPDEMSGDDYAEFIFLKTAFQQLNRIADSVEKDEKRHKLLRAIEGQISA